MLLVGIIQLIGAIFLAFTAGARAIESIYQLRQNPDLNTLGKIIQIVKNFFTIEKYETK